MTGCEGSPVRRLPPPVRPVGVALTAPGRPGGAPIVLRPPVPRRRPDRGVTTPAAGAGTEGPA